MGHSWRAFYLHRQAVKARYRTVFALTPGKRAQDVIMASIANGDRVLDVGASTRSLENKILQRFPDALYRTMDIDRTQDHDYYSLEEISEKFNVIILMEVIEHLSFQDGLAMMEQLYRLLVPGGRLIVTTPNLHHPSRYWTDCDHVTPYEYQNLGALLLTNNFSIDRIYRIYHDALLRRLFRQYVAAPVHRYFDIDFATTVVAVGVK